MVRIIRTAIIFFSLFCLQSISAQTCSVEIVDVTPVPRADLLCLVVEYESSQLDSVRLTISAQEIDTTVRADESVVIICMACDDVISDTLRLSDPSLMECQDFLTLDSLDCPGTCTIDEVTISEIVCNSDSTIQFLLDFFYDDVTNEFFDVFDDSGNVVYTGRYDSLPVVIHGFPWPGSGRFVIEVADNDNADCSAAGTGESPMCEPGCGFDMELLSLECDSTDLRARILVSCSESADSFRVAFGGVDQGMYSCSGEVISIGPIFLDSALFTIIEVRDLMDTSCAATRIVSNVCINGTCDLADLVAEPYGCTDDKYLVDVDLEREDVGSDSCIIQIGDEIIGTYAYSDVPVTLGPFPDRGREELRVLVTDQIFEYCTDFTEVLWEGCPRDSCEDQLSIVSTTCDDDIPFVLMQLDCRDTTYDYAVVYVESEDTIASGICTDTLALISLRLPSTPDRVLRLRVAYWSSDGDTCRSNITVDNPCYECTLESIAITDIECDSNGLLNFTLDAVHDEPDGTMVNVFGNFREELGTYRLSDFPIRLLGVRPRDSDDQFLLVSLNEDCRVETEFPTPDCLDERPCSDQDFIITEGQCEEREVQLIIVGETLPDTGSYEIFIDGISQGTYDHTEFPILSEPILADGQTVSVVLVLTTPDGVQCEYVERYELPTCTVSSTNPALPQVAIISRSSGIELYWSEPVLARTDIILYDLYGRQLTQAAVRAGDLSLKIAWPDGALGLRFVHVVGTGTYKIIR